MMSLADNHVLVQAHLRTAIERAVGLTWRSLPGYDRADIDQWLARIVPLVRAGQTQAIAATDLYLARALERQPLGVDAAAIISQTRNGVDSEVVYQRPFVETWGGLKSGQQWTDAVASGGARAVSAAAMDMQLAMRGAAREIGMADRGIYGFERVTDGKACALCVVASTQRYHTENLLPIHNFCGCSVSPLTSRTDRIVNKDLYRQISASDVYGKLQSQQSEAGYANRIAENRNKAVYWKSEFQKETDHTRRMRLGSRALRYEERANEQARALERLQIASRAAKEKITVSVVKHGELGPLLVNAADNFTSL